MALNFPIYLDNQATTPLDPRVLKAMTPYLGEKFGNPHSTSHRFGWEAAAAIDVARGKIANLIGAEAREIFFLSGATEANNLAIKGLAETYSGRKSRIITVSTEHKCVLESCLASEKWGFETTFLGVGKDGLVDLSDLEKALDESVALVSVMAVNNEIGVIQPLGEIGKLCKAKGILFHCDAAQAFGKTPLDVAAMKIDLMSLSGHKIYGPKGIGALYIKKSVKRLLAPQMSGGGQEGGLRSGTLPPVLCVGFGAAAAIAANEMSAEASRMKAVFRGFVQTLENSGIDFRINGSLKQRWHGNLSITFPEIDGDLLLSALKKIAVSSGAACASATEGPSYVLEALGVLEKAAKGTIRVGFGRFTTGDEAEYAAGYVAETVKRFKG
ncbi:MAG: aminotransferase class V-fold PLP-dependent enzyme [Proteobacteria bacterium]|nr:aminotransferase class V-fold PLP-dependent enzyme [Pseudomonadota bacterium]